MTKLSIVNLGKQKQPPHKMSDDDMWRSVQPNRKNDPTKATHKKEKRRGDSTISILKKIFTKKVNPQGKKNYIKLWLVHKKYRCYNKQSNSLDMNLFSKNAFCICFLKAMIWVFSETSLFSILTPFMSPKSVVLIWKWVLTMRFLLNFFFFFYKNENFTLIFIKWKWVWHYLQKCNYVIPSPKSISLTNSIVRMKPNHVF